MLRKKRTRYDKLLEPQKKVKTLQPNDQQQTEKESDQTTNDELFADLDFEELFINDTFAALQICRSQSQPPHILLKSHLYYIIKNRTVVDNDIEELKFLNKIREFKFTQGSRGEYYIMFIGDWEDAILGAKTRYLGRQTELENAARQKKQVVAKNPLLCGTPMGPDSISYGTAPLPPSLVKAASIQEKANVFDEFIKAIVHSYYEPIILEESLVQLLNLDNSKSLQKHLNFLQILLASECILNAGNYGDKKGYYLGCPGAGSLLMQIINGRKQIISALKRTRYKEKPAKEIEAKTLRNCSFSAHYLLKDLIGDERLEEVITPEGPIIKLEAT